MRPSGRASPEEKPKQKLKIKTVTVVQQALTRLTVIALETYLLTTWLMRVTTVRILLECLRERKLLQKLRMISGPSTNIKKPSTKIRMVLVITLPTVPRVAKRLLPNSLMKLTEKSLMAAPICSCRFEIPMRSPMLSIKLRSKLALLKISGRDVTKRCVSLKAVGTTIAIKLATKPETIIYERAIGSLRPSPGIISASLLTSGEIASAKKSEAPKMRRPALALKSKKPTATSPIRTSQNRRKVLVSMLSL